ncbi:hypothetical protein CHLNCDRAFT_19803 [Chlorella variabilis]|uniref:Signal recognition particle 9 kDa protein n=1 Tax=Chlorella variabilis TaxID=554065 RepID=E1Z6N0_CHLVA|nr:hypothetical protein CHLNCDRAFT_19803 [Chlorella variabilis]EFN58678.1 hypothetical protein CHLNCDRAFT_19803 [Chlorella variabilis]|eukprot:XP_005850780.1 hypothetical protein CHLNCDRAFT_19803 [Chlorella variabilis]
MIVENWDSFYQQAVDLYRNNPLKTRFVTKYRHCDGKLVLKVTDDSTCLQYKTDQQADLKKVEKLNRVFFELMATGQAPAGASEQDHFPASNACSYNDQA